MSRRKPTEEEFIAAFVAMSEPQRQLVEALLAAFQQTRPPPRKRAR